MSLIFELNNKTVMANFFMTHRKTYDKKFGAFWKGFYLVLHFIESSPLYAYINLKSN